MPRRGRRQAILPREAPINDRSPVRNYQRFPNRGPVFAGPACGHPTGLDTLLNAIKFMEWASNLAIRAGTPLVFTLVRQQGTVRFPEYLDGDDRDAWRRFYAAQWNTLVEILRCGCNPLLSIKASYGDTFLGSERLARCSACRRR